jgi:hypothetical protein
MLRLLIVLAVFLATGCASSSAVTRNPEKTNEVMITFVQRAQSGFWKEAMENVTPDERAEMMEDGQVMPEYKEAVGRIRLSAIKNMDLGLDSKGRLVGLINILDESNSMNRASDETYTSGLVDDFNIKMPKESKAKKPAAIPQEKPPEDEEFSSFLESLRKAASEPSEAGSEEEEKEEEEE